MNNLPEAIITFFAARNWSPLWSVDEALSNAPSHVRKHLEDCIASVEEDDICEIQADATFKFLHEKLSARERDREARITILGKKINSILIERRIRALQQAAKVSRPAPYDHEAIREVKIHDHNLISVEDFTIKDGGYLRDGYVFVITPTLQGDNSSYWINNVIQRPDITAEKFVRLDPFKVQPVEEYNPMFYKMFVYGVPLDWDRINSLREVQHARWMPDALSISDAAFTDVCWDPRGEEIHFICEEIPNEEKIMERGSRYLHAIYLPSKEEFIHVDGAVRFYTRDEIRVRYDEHVRNAGKIGTRVKIFQLDGIVPRDTWVDVASSFFVWNMDLCNYFAGKKSID